MELRLGSIPLRVQGWFLIMAVMLGANERDPVKLAIWVVVVIASVVVHELGHAMMGKAFGLVPRIELHAMGGTTSFSRPALPAGEPPPGPLGVVKNVAISLAGPLAGFLFALLVLVAELAGLQPTHPLATHALGLLFAVNVGWGIFNLLPMLPLDGGNVLRSVLIGVAKDKGDRLSRIISIVVAAGIALFAVRRGQWWILYLGILFAFRNVQALRQGGQTRSDEVLAAAIERAYAAYDRGAWGEVLALLEPALAASTPGELRALAVRVYVAALFEDGRLTEAFALIERERACITPDDFERYVSRLRESGRAADADRIAALGQTPAVLG
jgi:Zn-dependent protease